MDSFIPLLVVFFLGPMADKYGKKPAMIIVLLGFIGLSLVYIFEAAFVNWPVQVLYLGSLLVTMGGTWVVFNMAVYSYIASITTAESRTKRMGLADAIWYFGSPVGTFLGGILFKYYGYIAVYSTSAVLWTICLLYTIFLVPEGPLYRDEDCELAERKKCGPCYHIVQLFKTAFRKRPNHGRIYVYAVIALKLGVFLIQGHQMYLWARKVLRWDATQFSTWTSAEMGAEEVTILGWLPLVEKFGFHDCTIAGLGIFSLTLWSIILAFITGPSLWWLTIVASVLGILDASIEPAIRSMLTNVVGHGEEGKVLTVLGILESAWLSADKGIYTKLYNTFMEGFPQVNFVAQAGFGVVLLIGTYFLKKGLKGHYNTGAAVAGISYTQDVVDTT